MAAQLQQQTTGKDANIPSTINHDTKSKHKDDVTQQQPQQHQKQHQEQQHEQQQQQQHEQQEQEQQEHEQQEQELTGVAAKRVMKEYTECIKISFKPEPPFTVELVENRMNTWRVELYAIDVESDLHADMVDHGVASITLNVVFPHDYPFSPPFMRVVQPKISNGYVFQVSRQVELGLVWVL